VDVGLGDDTLSVCQPILQHTAAHCNTLQHTATYCNILQHTATHCNTLLHTATHCNTLQHTATHAKQGREAGDGGRERHLGEFVGQ